MLHLLWHLIGASALTALIGGAALGFGALALRPLRLPGATPAERLLFALAAGAATLALLMLLLGALGLISPPVIITLLLAGLALAINPREGRWALVPARLRGRGPTTGHAHHAQTAAPAAESDLVERGIWLGMLAVIALPLGYGLFAHALVPPTDYDVVAYHFAIPRLYAEAGRIVYLPYVLHSNWPLGTEMLFLIGLQLGSESAAQMVTLGFALMLCAALALFGERWLPRGSGWLAAAIFCAMPMVARLAGTGLVEMPLACYTFLALYALWHWRQSHAVGWLLLSAGMAGAAAATKLNGAAAALIFATLAAVLVAREGRPWRAVGVFAGYGLISFLVVLPWYLKAWVHTGNPIWPFLYPLLGGRNWDELGSVYLIGYLRTTNMDPTLTNWLTGLWQVTRANGRFGSFLLGPYALALLPLGLLPLVRRPTLRPLLALLGLSLLAFYSIWFLLTHQTRFLLPAMPFAILFGAAGVAWVCGNVPRPLRVAVLGGLLVWLLAGAWIFDGHQRETARRALPYLLGQVDRETYLTSVYDDYPAYAYLNHHLAPEARVLLAPMDVRGYYLDPAYLWANAIGQRYLRLEQLADADALYAELQRHGISHVLMNSRFVIQDVPYQEHINTLLNGLVERYGRLLYERGASRVYALDGPDTARLR